MIRIASIAFLLLIAQGVWAQGTLDKKAIKLVEKADEAIKARDFTIGRSLLQESIQRDSSYATPYIKLFSLLSILRLPADLHQLQLGYIRNVSEKELNPQIWQSLAYYKFGEGNYLEARNFLSKATSVDSLLVKSIHFALDQIQKKESLEIVEMPSAVNRFKHQYLPALTVDNSTLIFTARKSDTSDEDIVFSVFNGQEWSEAQSLADNINTRYNEGACSISADGRTLIFTSCEGRQSVGNCDLFISIKKGNNWSNPENLGKRVNSSSWDSQPTLSPDGKTLYFVSNRPGGYGGRDIWVSKWEKESWSIPTNLGPIVNTKQDETTPFMYSDNQTLFFSSNGHVGMGGFDLYKVERLGPSWTGVKNLGFPINTHNDEVSLIIGSDGNRAYFAKEEKSASTITSSKLVTYDISLSDKVVPRITYLTGTIKEAVTGNPLEALLEIVDLQTRQKLSQVSSDPVTGKYFLVLPSHGQFGAFIEKPNYLIEDVSFDTENKVIDTLDFKLHPLAKGAKMILKNVFFAFDSDELDEKSFEELDRVSQLLKEHPNMVIEISGHTDNVGAKNYNLDLSTRRAKKVYDFLLNNGVLSSRMTYIGRADAEPLNQNLTESEKRQNRRIEFKILNLQ